MTAPEINQDYMVYEGELPRHFKRRADEPADDTSFADLVADDDEAAVIPALAVVAAALLLGVGVGAGGTIFLMSRHHARPPPAAVASLAAPRPAPVPSAARAAPPSVEIPAPQLETAQPTPVEEPAAQTAKSAPPRKASARRAHRGASAAIAGSDAAGMACNTSGTHAATMICAWPAIAAADREMQRAYRHAVGVGVAPDALRASQEDWRATSELAAQRSAADLAAAYRRRIGELNALAADEPPH